MEEINCLCVQGSRVKGQELPEYTNCSSVVYRFDSSYEYERKVVAIYRCYSYSIFESKYSPKCAHFACTEQHPPSLVYLGQSQCKFVALLMSCKFTADIQRIDISKSPKDLLLCNVTSMILIKELLLREISTECKRVVIIC